MIAECVAADQWESEAEREQGSMATLLREAAKLVRGASESAGQDVSQLDNIKAAMQSRYALVTMLHAWVLACEYSPHADDRERAKPIADALALLDVEKVHS